MAVNRVGQIGRQAVAISFSQSAEAQSHQAAMTDVAQLYLGVLEKTPNSNGFPTWVNRLENQGWTVAGVARTFMTYNSYWITC